MQVLRNVKNTGPDNRLVQQVGFSNIMIFQALTSVPTDLLLHHLDSYTLLKSCTLHMHLTAKMHVQATLIRTQ
jgi:hypothetical protein